MTPEQKAELRRQCEAECDNRYTDPVMLDYERLLAWKTDVYTMGLIRKACAELLYAERLRVQPLIEAGNELREAGGDVGYEAEEGMPITDESACMKSLERAEAKWIAALTAYQNTER